MPGTLPTATLPTATILSEGQPIRPEIQLITLDIRYELDRVPWAMLNFVDGDVAQQKFEVSDGATFAPGAEIEIKLRYEGEPGSEKSVFKGRVVRHAVEFTRSELRLCVELKDAAVRLTQGRKTRVFADKKDSDVFKALIQEAGLKTGVIAATDVVHKELVQYHCTDWDFALARAEVNGLAVVVADGKVSLADPNKAGANQWDINFGIGDVYEFEMAVDVGDQSPAVSSWGWDVKKQSVAVDKAADFKVKQGNVDGANAAKKLGFGDSVLRHGASAVPQELKAWARSRMVRGRSSLLRGRVSLPGLPKVQLLDEIKLGGIGKRFNGTTVVTGFRHRLDIDGWTTDLQFGRSPRGLLETASIADAPAGGLIPPARGLQVAVVTQFKEDPDKELRVRVLLPGPESKKVEVWARLTAPDAGNKRGWFFVPEVGDEVVVAFLDDDPRQPVILGSLFSSKNVAPSSLGPPSQKNEKKGLVTRAGTKLWFNDAEKPAVTIETPAGNKAILDDDAGSIQLVDKNGNKLVMDKDGIQLKSAKDLKLEGSGNVTISGQKVDVK